MKTIKRECEIVFEEKKSKFIGYIKPVTSKEEAEEFIESIKRKHYDATHNCSAYKINSDGKEYFKFDDDGEPSGTSGKPMADIIKYMDVDNVAIVATRYFGGIKLGAGGLVRNYAKTAKLAIYEAEIVDYIKRETYIIEFSYESIADVDSALSDSNCIFLDKAFLDRVVYKVELDDKSLNNLNQLKNIQLTKL